MGHYSDSKRKQVASQHAYAVCYTLMHGFRGLESSFYQNYCTIKKLWQTLNESESKEERELSAVWVLRCRNTQSIYLLWWSFDDALPLSSQMPAVTALSSQRAILMPGSHYRFLGPVWPRSGPPGNQRRNWRPCLALMFSPGYLLMPVGDRSWI